MAKKSRKRRKKCYCGIGGQAVLEGIMMKNNDRYAIAVRKADGNIELKTEEHKGFGGGKKFAKLPFIRGVVNFVDSLVLGMNCLTWSAEFFEEEDETKAKSSKEGLLDKLTGGNGEKIVMGLTVAFSILMAVGIFIMLPYGISLLFSSYIRNASLLAILEGIVRILIFVGYVVAISAMKDIRRVYMYHGAEHKCINCIERGRELTVKNVRKSSRLHKRCGTSFMLFVVLISVILFMFIKVENPAMRLVIRLALIPVIAGISYEILRLAGRSDNIFMSLISAPGMFLQKLTTKEPDDDMIRVAIASVEAVFDWKAFLNETFGYDVDAWEKKEKELAQEEEQEAADAENAAVGTEAAEEAVAAADAASEKGLAPENAAEADSTEPEADSAESEADSAEPEADDAETEKESGDQA